GLLPGRKTREAWGRASWWARRRALPALAPAVPMLLVVYSVVASCIAQPGDLAREHSRLIFAALLIAGAGGYAIWNSLTALMTANAMTPRRPVRSPARAMSRPPGVAAPPRPVVLHRRPAGRKARRRRPSTAAPAPA